MDDQMGAMSIAIQLANSGSIHPFIPYLPCTCCLYPILFLGRPGIIVAPFSPVRDHGPRVCLDWFSSHAFVKVESLFAAYPVNQGNMTTSNRNA